ncbi:hypothetical protein [Denitromonas halophila]|nr:hypothetical protein [Denitromonas halophila]
MGADLEDAVAAGHMGDAGDHGAEGFARAVGVGVVGVGAQRRVAGVAGEAVGGVVAEALVVGGAVLVKAGDAPGQIVAEVERLLAQGVALRPAVGVLAAVVDDENRACSLFFDNIYLGSDPTDAISKKMSSSSSG